MSFRLIYEGELLSANAGDRTAVRRNKHAIRKQLHPQLKSLWKTDRLLRFLAGSPPIGVPYSADNPPAPDEGLRDLAKRYERCGNGFVPLVLDEWFLICSLSILFLRREPPGAIVQGGDIDNRIKTLFDGLRIPENCEDVTDPPTEDEKPMFCLLQDDRLITEIKVTTDLLLRPPKGIAKHDLNDVLLVIEADLRQTGKPW